MLSEFTPHGFCLAWEPLLLQLTVFGHAATAFAYFGIPIMLLTALRQIFMVPAWLLGMFAGFILACGISHVLAIVTLWYPIYWVEALEVLATALISLSTLYLLPLGIAEIIRRQPRNQ